MVRRSYSLIRCVNTGCIKIVTKKSIKKKNGNIYHSGTHKNINQLFTSSDIEQLKAMQMQISYCRVLISDRTEKKEDETIVDSVLSNSREISDVKMSTSKEVVEVLNSDIDESSSANDVTGFINKDSIGGENAESCLLSTASTMEISLSKIQVENLITNNELSPSSGKRTENSHSSTCSNKIIIENEISVNLKHDTDENISKVTAETDGDDLLETSKSECLKKCVVLPSSVSENFVEKGCDKESISTDFELSSACQKVSGRKRLFLQDESLQHAAYQSSRFCFSSNYDEKANKECRDEEINLNKIKENDTNTDAELPETTEKIQKFVYTNLIIDEESSIVIENAQNSIEATNVIESNQAKNTFMSTCKNDQNMFDSAINEGLETSNVKVLTCKKVDQVLTLGIVDENASLNNDTGHTNWDCIRDENAESCLLSVAKIVEISSSSNEAENLITNNVLSVSSSKQTENSHSDTTAKKYINGHEFFEELEPVVQKNGHDTAETDEGLQKDAVEPGSVSENINEKDFNKGSTNTYYELPSPSQKQSVKRRLFQEDESTQYDDVACSSSKSDNTANEECCDDEINSNSIEEKDTNTVMGLLETLEKMKIANRSINAKNENKTKQENDSLTAKAKMDQKNLDSVIKNRCLETSNVTALTCKEVDEVLNSDIAHKNTTTNNGNEVINRNIVGGAGESTELCLLSTASTMELASTSNQVENVIADNQISLFSSTDTSHSNSNIKKCINENEISVKSNYAGEKIAIHITAETNEDDLLEFSKSKGFKKNAVQYSISNDEEDSNFDAEADLSENEYIPSSVSENSSEDDMGSVSTDYELSPIREEDSVKKRLFTQDESKQHANTKAADDASSGFSCNSGDKQSTSSCFLPNSDEATNEDCDELIQRACCIHIKGFSVYADVNTVLHKGTLSGNLIRLTYEEAVTSIAVTTRCHICVFPDESLQGQECAALVWKKDQTFELSSNYCIMPGKYNGEGTFFPSMKATYAPLYKATCSKTKAGSSLEVIPISSNKTKSNFCMFCSRLRTSFARHVLMQHQDEEEVKDILKTEKGSLERKKALNKLRAKSNHIYNTAAKKLGSSERIVYRKGKLTSKTEYVPCPNCECLFIKRNLARHEKKCSGRPANRARILSKAKAKDDISSSEPSHLSIKCKTEQKILEKILEPIKNDEIGKIAKGDDTILQMAKRQAIARAKEPHLANNIRQEMRLMARLLAELRDIDSTICELKDVFFPQKYEAIKEAIYRICQLDEKKFDFKLPTIALRYRSIISKCIDHIELTYIQNNVPSNSNKMDTLQNFRKIHEKMFNVYVNKKAWKTTLENRLNENKQLPTLYDIKCYNDYINSVARRSSDNLKSKGFQYVDWLNLGKAMLLQIQLFNRRRCGETSRLPLKSFYNREKIPDEEKKVLNRLELLLANSIERMRNIGKRNRILSFLIKNKQIEYIELLISMRQQAGVSPDNPYLFAVPHGTKYLNGWAAMREFSEKCGAKDSKTLRGTTLRKQIATTSQLLSLTDNEIAQIADFMGHDEKVHRAVYRQQNLTLQITRIAKFFMAVGDPNVQQFKGKTIEELAVIGDGETESDHELLESDEDEPEQDELVNRTCNIQEMDNRTEDIVVETETTIGVNKSSVSVDEIHQGSSTPSKRNTRKRKMHVTPTSTPKKSKATTFDILNELRSPRRRVVRKRKMWTEKEKELVRKQFSRYIYEQRPPPRTSIATFLKRESKSLGHRDVSGVYAWITSEIQRNRNKCFD